MRTLPVLLALACGAPEAPAPAAPDAPAPEVRAEVDRTPERPGAWALGDRLRLERDADRGAVVLLDDRGGKYVLAHASAPSVALSQDGGRAAWVRLPAGGPEGALDVLTVGDDGEVPVPKTVARGVLDRVAMTPDGAHIAYVRGGDVPRIELIAAEGGEPTVLTNADVVRTPGKAPEGFVPPPHQGPPRFEGDRLVWEAPDGPHEVRWR